MAKTYRFENRTAVVTGAASGIGAALAQRLSERGCHLALSDINADGLESVAEQLKSNDRRVTTQAFDVGDRDAIYRFADEVREAHGHADLVFNNAGVATMGTFEQVSEQDFDWLLGINLHGPIRMTRAFLPQLHQSNDAHIVNISSIFGMVAPPGQTAYCASKFGLLGFSDALRHEFEDSSIGVTTVHPGGINTNIAAAARVPDDSDEAELEELQKSVQELLVMPPVDAADIILQAVTKRRPRVIVGSDAKRMAFLQRLMPFNYWKLIKRSIDTDALEVTRS